MHLGNSLSYVISNSKFKKNILKIFSWLIAGTYLKNLKKVENILKIFKVLKNIPTKI